MISRSSGGGFSLIELVIAIAIVVAVAGGIFTLVGPSWGFFDAELERSDLQQRIRAASESLIRDLTMAGAGSRSPAVAPYRRGVVAPDPPGAVFADRISITFIPPDSTVADVITRTYWMRFDSSGAAQLMRYDGSKSDLPVVDHVIGLRFDYFGEAGVVLPLSGFADGPWLIEPLSGVFDADLLAVRRVGVTLRVRRSRQILRTPWSERETRFDVAPRNLNLQ